MMTRDQAERVAWVAGIIGLVGVAIGAVLAPAAFPHAWLAALATWLGWPLGCMGLLLIHALTGGRWGYAIRPQLVAGMNTLWLLLPIAIPWLLVLPALYPWVQPEMAAQLANGFYLNLPFFLARGIIYLIIWFGLFALMVRALRSSDPDAALGRLAPAGLILLAITVTYATIDLTMSLDPHFASSVYGLVTIAEMGLLALAVSMFAATIGMPPDSDTLQSQGNLLMGLLILWAYLDFVQLLIVWQSDLPNEAPWYIVRSAGGWGIVAAIVATTHFVLPFLALLAPSLQRSRRGIIAITGLLIIGEVIHGWWLVVPAAGRGSSLLDFLAMLGIVGISAALALRAPLLPSMSEGVSGHV
jgi:hypothetical protein